MRRESFRLLRPAALRGLPEASAPPSVGGGAVVPACPLGVARADAWLHGGLKSDGVHEFQAAAPGDLPAALGFTLLLGARGGRALIWLRREGAGVPYGPGLADLGIDPASVTLVGLAEDRALLRAAHDALRSGAAGAVLLELAGRQPLLDLTATRRLVLAAGEAGAMMLVVRAEAEPASSAAHSRWRVGSAPSRALEADAPGHPAFDLTLLRHRGGRDGLHIIVEWNRDTASFREREEQAAASLSGGAPAMDAGRGRPDPQGRAA